jgi:cytochrome c-type biogenesis protein
MFISPCCLPLVPGYLSYATGMSGAGADQPPHGIPAGGAHTAARGRTVAGTALFVPGFSALFASYGLAFGGLGAMLLTTSGC